MLTRSQRLKRHGIIILTLIVVVVAAGWLINYSIRNATYFDNNSLTPAQITDQYFNKALALMVNKQYQLAVVEWNQLLLLNPSLPEAHVNLGFSLFEIGMYQMAMDHFLQALDIKQYQVNAYYGLAICYEKLGDIQAASGAMRSFIHLADKADPYVRKARSALWEWENEQQVLEKSDNPAETK